MVARSTPLCVNLPVVGLNNITCGQFAIYLFKILSVNLTSLFPFDALYCSMRKEFM